LELIRKHFYSFIYALSTSLSFVFIAKIEESLPPLLCLFISILFTVIFFHLVNIKFIPYVYKKIVQAPIHWIALSITIAVIWGVSFYGTNEVGGFVFLFIYFISSAIISYIVLVLNRSNFSYHQLISTIGLIILLAIFIGYNLSSLLGISLAMVGGICSYFYRKISFIIAEKCQLSAGQRLTVSYYLIILPSVFIIPRSNYELLNLTTITALGGIAILSFIIPLYSNQKGIEYAGPEHHSIISAICPLLTCLLEFYINGTWILFNLISSIIGSFFLILGKLKFKA